MANHFVLADSNNSRIRKFRVIASGYAHVLEKSQSINKTVDGKLDVSVGSVQERYMFSVRVRYEEPDDGDLYNVDWGTLNDLQYFYSLNNPNGTPSNQLTFVDHYGNEKQVIMAGDYNSQVQGIMIAGTDAWFVVNCVFMNVDV